LLYSISAENDGKGRGMRVTLSKCIPTKRIFGDPATDGLRSMVLSPMDGSFEEKIYGKTEEVDELGKNRIE
jgi:hypothetical protein